MRELQAGTSEQINEDGEKLTCVYSILVRYMETEPHLESYGIRVSVVETGEQAELLDLTTSSARISELANRLAGGGVTPCALGDVVEDWL
jgi:hypothetical protein